MNKTFIPDTNHSRCGTREYHWCFTSQNNISDTMQIFSYFSTENTKHTTRLNFSSLYETRLFSTGELGQKIVCIFKGSLTLLRGKFRFLPAWVSILKKWAPFWSHPSRPSAFASESTESEVLYRATSSYIARVLLFICGIHKIFGNQLKVQCHSTRPDPTLPPGPQISLNRFNGLIVKARFSRWTLNDVRARNVVHHRVLCKEANGRTALIDWVGYRWDRK